MKAVTLTNGARAIPVRIEFFLTREDLVDALAYDRRHDGDEDLPELSKTQVVTAVRDTLASAGDQTYHYWVDYAVHHEQKLRSWAERHIDQVYGSALASD